MANDLCITCDRRNQSCPIEPIARVEDCVMHEPESHNPNHYRDKSVEPIDAIRSWLGDVAFVQYCRGNIVKYCSRLGDKDESVKEARKIETYARWMKETLEGKGLSK